MPIASVASVASFFASRIDVLIDPLLEQLSSQGSINAELAETLHGQVAIANAKTAYQIYKEICDSDRFQKLAARGARSQRLLWASTSTKNPAYSDVKYIEALIGRDTIDTVPVASLDKYRDHGQPAPRIEQQVDKATWMLERLPELGISIDNLTQQLEDEGVKMVSQSFDQLLAKLGTAVNQREPASRT